MTAYEAAAIVLIFALFLVLGGALWADRWDRKRADARRRNQAHPWR